MKPLFERLSCENEVSFHSSFTVEDLKVSIANEVSRIVTTRYHIVNTMPAPVARSILDFGIPSVVSFGKHNSRQHELLAAEIRQAITSFEPRLTNVQVEMDISADKYTPLKCFVKGVLKLNHEVEEFQFPVDLSGDEAID